MRTQVNTYLKAAGIAEILPVRAINISNSPLREELGNIEELAQSIRNRGILEPIIVRPAGSRFEIIAGHRRYRACKLNDISEIPAIVVDASEKEAFEISLEENLHRKTLDPIEEARAFQQYVDRYGYGSVSELARAIGKSQEYVSQRLMLLSLPLVVQEQVRRRLISSSDAWEISRIKDPRRQEELTEEAIRGNWIVKEIRAAANDAIRERLLVRSSSTRGNPSDGFSEFKEERDQLRETKIRKAASTILRIAQIRLDDLVNGLDEDEVEIREELLKTRLKVHGIIDKLIGKRICDERVTKNVTTFIYDLFLRSVNTRNLAVLNKLRSKSLTIFDDCPPYSLLTSKQ